MTDDRPLLYLDVDGVIALRAWPRGPYSRYFVTPHMTLPDSPIRTHIRDDWARTWARQLHEAFQIVRATTWGREANRVIAPILGLPTGLPVLRFPRWDESDEDRLFGKTLDVAAHSAGRLFVWIDDDAGDADRAWLAENPAVGEHLLIVPSPRQGLLPRHFRRIMQWAERADR